MILSIRTLLAQGLQGLARAVCRHPRWFVWPQVGLALACVAYTALDLKLDMNRDNLIGPGMKYHQIYLQYRKEFPGEDDMVVLVQSANQERNRQFVERLGARVLCETNLFADTLYKTDFASLGRKGLLLASTNDLQGLETSLEKFLPAISVFTRATNLNSLFELVNSQFRAAGEQTPANEALVQALPSLRRILDQARQSMARPGIAPGPGIESLLGGGAEAEREVYVTLENGNTFLFTTRPGNESLTPAAIERLRQFIGEVQTEVPGVNVGLTGGPVLDYDEMVQSEHDSTLASIAALVICSLIFIVAYRELGRPLKSAFCLLIGVSYTMGFATLAIGHLNILTITFVPMLIGLAIDFGIHFITRYEEEMRHGRSEQEAVYKATVFTGQGIVAGGLTTAGAFLAMALTHFRGIQEMGLICGAGLLLCLVPVLTTLPALVINGRQNTRDHQLGPPGATRIRIEKLWLARPWLVIGATAVLCGAAAVQLHRVGFDYDLLHMQSQRLPSVRTERELLQPGKRSTIYAVVVCDSVAQAQEFAGRLKRLPSVGDVESIVELLGQDQEPKLRLVDRIKREVARLHFAPIDRPLVRRYELSATLWRLTGYLDLGARAAQRDAPEIASELKQLRRGINSFRKALIAATPEALKRLTGFQQQLFLNLHRTFRTLREQNTSAPLRAGDLPPALHDRFVGTHGKVLVQVYPKLDIWQHSVQQEFIGELESVAGDQRVTGPPVQFYAYTTLLKQSYEQAAIYALIAIALLIFLQFRSLSAALLSLLPVAVGSVWLLGVMGAADINFNPANIMTLPLVIGIGVTNGIHILNRFAEEQKPAVLAKSTGKAVLVSGLTAITGFGTLMLAGHLGIRSLGEVMSLGIAFCMIAGLTFLPSLLCVLTRRGWTIRLQIRPPKLALGSASH